MPSLRETILCFKRPLTPPLVLKNNTLYIGNLLTYVIQSVRVQVLRGGVGGHINLCNPVIRTLGGYRKSLRTHHVVP